MLNAFCRVAPSVRFSFLAIRAAGVFLFAIDFSSRTCTDVHERLFLPFFINESPYMSAGLVAGSCQKTSLTPVSGKISPYADLSRFATTVFGTKDKIDVGIPYQMS